MSLLPPFDFNSAQQKVRFAEDAWNSCDPARVASVYTLDTRWRNRSEFIEGRQAVEQFLQRKWHKEQHYRLIKELWAWHQQVIAVRFAYEWQNDQGQWFRSYGNENWRFNPDGLMAERYASINDVPIGESQRLFRWSGARRPDDHPGLTALGL
ncbi:hypothetical protein BL250_08985 [Erwinia sp. OLTSP20]|nr:hypothetical protein BV501_10050 [Erwinia sp. OAMSP11]PIJ71943.1 hypothetical protein BK416_10695 [Erwinia sp. OLSSP12]PIJ80925.1 hypothetical protein BLD47_10175 [Erwinia sp. OLCASP19]PIJ83830.1 hypothetical protein BLD46_09100 [Erwinia sp. OLMTSP26]PIJ85988.1 hypothetical protein BLD49_09085 [Erwinia sp. OLMDSP33]PIJ92611.1 hypothetical protein BL250_08985 [Erwinia sp. OLTSP20]PIJ93479.1 hypothetical protein BL249_04370 [Erwinia sp. OLFS4]